MKEKTTKTRKKSKSLKSEVKRNKVIKNSGRDEQLTDSSATHGGVQKCRATFLVGQFFRGVYYQEGQSITLSCEEAKAYSKRATVKFEQL